MTTFNIYFHEADNNYSIGTDADGYLTSVDTLQAAFMWIVARRQLSMTKETLFTINYGGVITAVVENNNASVST